MLSALLTNSHDRIEMNTSQLTLRTSRQVGNSLVFVKKAKRYNLTLQYCKQLLVQACSRRKTEIIRQYKMSISTKTQTLFKDLYKTKLRTYWGPQSHSIDEGDGSETVTIKTVETSSRFHKLCRVYSNSLNMSNLSPNFSADELLGTTPKFRRQRNDTPRRVFTSSISRRIRHFHVMVVQEWQGNLEMYKKVSCTCKIVVSLNKPIPFFAISLPSPLVECCLILSLSS